MRNAKALTVESNIKYIFCLYKIYIVIKELDALLVIHDTAAYFLFASEALASLFYYRAERWPLFLTKVHYALLLRLVHASIQTDFYLNRKSIEDSNELVITS